MPCLGVTDPDVLTINAGSSSLKVAAFRASSLERTETIEVTGVTDHDAALAAVLARFGRIAWRAIGHRVTHGRDYLRPQVVDATVRAALEALIPLAPLHQPHNLAGIAAAARLAPNAVQIACFDTSFHRTIPDVARRYALPRELVVESYGFHGLSYEYIASQLPDHVGARADGRVIVAHLGSGASLCAVRARTSIATTMGLTPLDGLPMATRSGSIDPGVVLYLLEERRQSVAEVRDLLYRRSGWLGVSGVSDSMQVLLASPARGAAAAVELFVYRCVRAIGSLAAALGGLDVLVFTGGSGEHSAQIRTRIADKLAWLGAEPDPHAHGSVFNTPASKVVLCAMPTDEELVIARHVAAILRDRA